MVSDCHLAELVILPQISSLYFCRREAKINQRSQKYIDIFFLGNKYICNKQLIKMLARSLIIFPAFLMIPIFNMNRFFNLFIDRW